MATYKITLSKSDWNGGTEAIWYDSLTQSFFFDADLTQEATSIVPPSRECHRFDGYYSASSSGVQYIDDMGNFTDALMSLSITAAKTFNAQGTRISWKLTLDDNGGEDGDGALFYRIDGGGFFDNYPCEGEPVTTVGKPFRAEYAFAGYYNGTSTPGTQYIDQNGGFTSSLDALTLTAAKTIHARWVAPYKVTVSANSGTGGTAAFYFDSVSGKFYAAADLAEEISAITPHIRECFAFVGCYSSNNTTSAVRVAADGTIAAEWTPTAATTIYAQWRRVSWKLTINKSSGTGGTNALYYRVDGGGYYSDAPCTQEASAIECPYRANYVFKGCFNSTSGTTQYIDRTGQVLDALTSLALTAAKTIYAQWKPAYKITFNKSSGDGGTDAIWYSAEDNAFFADAACTIPAPSITIPARECYRFDGYYNTSSGSTQYVDANGVYTDALDSLSITSGKTFYAKWTRISYKATLDDNGGEGGSGAFYCDGTTATFYADDKLTAQIGSVAVPARTGYSPLGYYAARTGGSRYIDGDGDILLTGAFSADLTLYARWQAREYNLGFDYAPGRGATASKTVTFGAAIGQLPAPEANPPRSTFARWEIGGAAISPNTVWNIPDDATAHAAYRYFFASVEDYFNLASATLVPIESDPGDNRQYVVTRHYGKFKKTATGGVEGFESASAASGKAWRNPTVKYMVVGDMTLAVTLGKAFAATTGATGYMITSVTVETGIRRFPVVTVWGTANEGVNAINIFNVSVPILARARPQNLLGAIAVSGGKTTGGELHACSLRASCDPVVLAENMMPCASDVVGGRYELHAETLVEAGESAPTMASSGGFTLIAAPPADEGANYRRYRVTARKEIV